MNVQGRERDDSLPLSIVNLVDHLCDRFEADWSADRPPRIEDFLAEVPPAAVPSLLRELLLLELA